MTSVENTLTKRIQVAFRKYLGPFSIAETLPKHRMLQTPQSGKVREGSGKGNGKVETVSETVFNKTGKVQEGSGKVNGKVETDLSKHRSPGRSGKDPGR